MSITYPTLADIVAATTLRVGQVSSIGVQVYSEDVLAEMIKHKFDILFDKFEVPEYMSWYVGTLGSDGKCTADVTDSSIGLLRFKDIVGVWYEDDKSPLKLFPHKRNVASYATTGTHPQFIEATSDNKIFRCIGLGNAGDTVYVRHKLYPEEIIATTELKVDKQALILGAAYDYLADDNANPAATEKMRNMFNQRIEQLTSDTSNIEMHDPRGGGNYNHETSGYVTVG